MEPENPVTSERITGPIPDSVSVKTEPSAATGIRRKASIRFWLASLVVACVLPIWIAAGILVYHNYQSKRELTEQRTVETAQALTLDVDRELANMQSTLVALSTSTALITGDLHSFYLESQVLLTVARPGADIILADASGQELMNTSLPFGAPLPRRGSLESGRQVFDTGRPVTGNVYQGAASEGLKISVDVPVLRSGRVVYDLAMAVPPDRFSTFLRELYLPPEWIGTIFDAHHMIVARTSSSEQMNGSPIDPALRRRMENAAGGTAEFVTRDGAPTFNCLRHSETSGWTVVIGVPQAIMMAEIWRWLALTIAGTALLSFTGIALALVMARRIAASIQGLTAPALALGRGEPVSIGSFGLAETNAVGISLLKASELIQQRAEERERAEAARREADELKRFNSELELREAAARARATELSVIMDTVPAAMFIGHDPECRRMTSNRAACELLRLPPGARNAQFTPCGGKESGYRMLRDGRELPRAEMPVQLAAATGIEIRDCECTVAFDDGTSRIIFGNAVPLLDESGKSQGAVGAFIDITDRKRNAEVLRLNEERLRLAQHSASLGVFDVELHSGKRMWSPQMFQIFGRAADSPQPSAEDVLSMCHPDDRSLVEEQFVHMRAGKAIHVECRIIRPDGEVRWVEIFGKTLVDDAGQPIRCLGVGRDITGRKRAEDYRRWSEDQLRALAMRLQTAAERESLRIARELHDQLGQALTGMKMDLDWIVRKHGTSGGPWVPMVQDSMKVVDSTIALVRKIATDLRPDMLDALGLSAAIEWHSEEFQRRTGISCAVHVPENLLVIPDDERIAVFRIYQEALTNIARHAKAKNVLVSLEREQNEAVLTISDDGVGFPVDRLEQGQSLGVVGMRERALLLGARFQIRSSQGNGTTITLRIPLGDAATTEQ